MNMKVIAALAAAAVCIFSTSVASQTAKDWIDVKSAEDLRALFVNKTFRGKDYLGRPFVEHFSGDGKGVRIMGDETRIPRNWTLKGTDQVCVSLPWEVPCYRVRKHRTTAGLYRFVNVGNDQVTDVSVEDGIPKF